MVQFGLEFPSTRTVKFTAPKDRLFFSDLYKDIIEQKPLLIFPGQEERLRRAQWDAFYQFFKEQLTKYCLFVGYSFRHDVINEPILDNLEDGRIRKLGILTPNPRRNLKNLFQRKRIPNDKIIEMPAKFGEPNAIVELRTNWMPHIVGVKSINRDDFSREASNWKMKREERYVK